MADTNNKKRIENSTAVIMAFVALFFDLLEIVLLLLWGVGLVLNRLVVFIKWWIFWFWFSNHNVSFTKLDNKKSVQRLAVLSITAVIGMIPGLGALPEFTIGIIALNILVQAEDKIGLSTQKADELIKRGRTIKRNVQEKTRNNSGRTPARFKRAEIVQSAT